MFFRMALTPCLLLLVGIAIAVPLEKSQDTELSTEHASNSLSPEIVKTTPNNSLSLDGDAIKNAAISQALGKGDFYDQRQDGELNVHVRVDNATVYFVMFDVLGELAWRKGNKESVKGHMGKRISGLKRTSTSDGSSHINTSSAAVTSPNAVSASPPAAVSASTPTRPDFLSENMKPPRSTYKPPSVIVSETSSLPQIEVTSEEPESTTSVSKKIDNETERENLLITTEKINQGNSVKPAGISLATAKSQARSEEQISILNLLKRTATLTAHAGASLRRHHKTANQPNHR